jgi:predicted lipoprotein with Yx(FWY)xxD motif
LPYSKEEDRISTYFSRCAAVLLFKKLSFNIQNLFMKRSNYFPLGGFVLIAMMLLSSCSHENLEPKAIPPTIQLKTSATLGTYLSDSVGYTLYYFSNDFDGNSNCTGGCLNVWPIYFAGDNLTQDKLPSTLDIADFGTITTATGLKQTTYKTWPLYYYAPLVNGTNTRESPAETKGEGVGNIWFVAKPDYTIMEVNAQLIGNNGKTYKSDYTVGTGKTLYFSDMKGVTLYAFSQDSFNINKYTKPDFSNNPTWPLYETNKIVVPSTLDKSLFGSINVFGKPQLTYKGWPIYYFGPDSMKRGLNKGVSVPNAGVWPVIGKDVPNAPR